MNNNKQIKQYETVMKSWYTKNTIALCDERTFTVENLYQISLETGYSMRSFITGSVFETKKDSWNKYDQAVCSVKTMKDAPKKLGMNEKINARFNKLLIDKDAETMTCPICGRQVNWKSYGWGGNDNYCKYCRTPINPEVTGFSKETLGKNLKKARQSRKLKLSDVVQRIHYTSPSSLSSWESGKAEIPVCALFLLSNIYEETMESLINPYLLSGSKDEPLKPVFKINNEDTTSYAWFPDEFDDYVPTCASCGEIIDLTLEEALSHSVQLFIQYKRFSKHNDGCFCKKCGQRLNRNLAGSNLISNIYELIAEL